ncbi:hypothetical protein ALT_1985 [Aspergillus lentulus]|uniref:Uncharacterized protein n=1 Tax=Aspergillus lentulus TaxID=293939 RepID=A0AAN4PDA4_ASPLE|nr:hypothetical protein CNMCM6069_004304 [Aspergillus lentulus]KAF4166404.1 hypothetical protein CNMCM6936_006604 [Aspergillus lentulus]KAF4172823.1 hypothetical protein CNMCM8060_000975 [Aspergillus lentulus]KAF4179250.1 hypothetical protein CNMCM7927_002055 [Aspergillus lentulus]KAF4191682.1 hypothetical protein CNMCM8694_001458 [Aspergillus lentulus]
MTLRLARQDNTCTGSKQWYVCSKGNFRGCCSVDPCNTGICPDQADQTTLSTSTTSTTSKTASNTTATSPTAAITTAPSTSSLGDIPGIIPTRTVTQAVAPATDTDAANASHGSDHGALIGGVVGGVLALILLAGLLFLVYLSRKKRGKRFVLLRWRVTRAESDEKGSTVASGRGIVSGNEGRLLDVPNSNTPSPTVVNQALTVPGSERTSAISNTISQPSCAITNSNTSKIPAPAETTHHSSVSSLPPASSTTSHPSPGLNLNLNLSTSTSPAPPPDRADTTPELFDTGFYRQRAELAAYSQSELINIPPERRQIQVPPAQHTNSEIDLPAQPQLPSIITPDGVILGANFDYRVPRDDQYPGSGEGIGHVLSFMRFEEGEGSERREEWRKSFESGTGV